MNKEHNPEDRPIPPLPTPGAGFYDAQKEKPQDFQTPVGVRTPQPAKVGERETERLNGLGVAPPDGTEKVTE